MKDVASCDKPGSAASKHLDQDFRMGISLEPEMAGNLLKRSIIISRGIEINRDFVSNGE